MRAFAALGRLVCWVVVALLAVGLALFAGSNRDSVALALWPLGHVLELPLYLALLGAGLTGLVIGALLAWRAGRHGRREARRRGRRLAALEGELAATQAQLPAASPGLPRRRTG